MKAWRVQEGGVLSPVLPHTPPRPTQPSRSAKLLIIQAINLHPLNLAAPSLSPSDCSNGGTPGHRRLIFLCILFFYFLFWLFWFFSAL